MARSGVVAALAAVAVLAACDLSQEVGCEYIPPVLDVSAALSAQPQSWQFEFGPNGRHELVYYISLRHGPASSPGKYSLQGVAEVVDSEGTIQFHEEFTEAIRPNQVGGTLFSFSSWWVNGPSPHTLSLRLEPFDQAILDAYDGLELRLKRQPVLWLCGY